MRRLLFIQVMALIFFHAPARADKFVNTGPGTINTCDTLSRVGIGLVDDEDMDEMSQLVLGGSNVYDDDEIGSRLQFSSPKHMDGLGAFFQTNVEWDYDLEYHRPQLRMSSGPGMPLWPIVSWSLLYYEPSVIYTPLIAANGLYVNGEVEASSGVRVNGTLLNVPDFVFEPGFKLRSLEETERFVKANRHLPDIPNAEAIKKDGMNLADMNLKLLQKVEELTLHAIEQEKRIKALEARVVSH